MEKQQKQHLAIFTPPFLDLILEGRKTVEGRFSKVRCAPFGVVQEGDVVNIDMSIGHHGLIVDSGITVGVGEISPEDEMLLRVTKEALVLGIKAAQPGAHIGDIGHVIQTHVEAHGFSVVEVLCGHGVGYAVHEEPTIPNYGKPGTGPKIEVGHVYAIEPIVNVGKPDVLFDDEGDGYRLFGQGRRLMLLLRRIARHIRFG